MNCILILVIWGLQSVTSQQIITKSKLECESVAMVYKMQKKGSWSFIETHCLEVSKP